VFDAAGLQGRVRFAFSECLGPCSEANVIFVYLNGRPLWFRRINTAELFDSLLSYVRTAVDAPGAALPETLTAYSFSWTGGGVGPELA
jgi:(2Fe-2S) ferredoxin